MRVFFPLECLGFRVQGLGFGGRGFRGLGTKSRMQPQHSKPRTLFKCSLAQQRSIRPKMDHKGICTDSAASVIEM